jgi:hypothetical protein
MVTVSTGKGLALTAFARRVVPCAFTACTSALRLAFIIVAIFEREERRDDQKN